MKKYITQRSLEWHEWRKGKIGSSLAPTIMGLNPYCSAKQLWNRMKGFSPEQTVTDKMRRGIELEGEVLQWLEKEVNIPFQPSCFESDENPLLIASLDGSNERLKALCEIKVSPGRYEMAKEKRISEMDNCQMQHQFMVTGYSEGLFCAYDGFEGAIVEVKRDDAFIEKMVAEEMKFIELLKGNEGPEDIEDQYTPINLADYQQDIVKDWIEVSSRLRSIEEEEKRLRNSILDLGDDGNCLLQYEGMPLLKMQRIQREGNVDWKGVCKAKGITEAEIAAFRKKQIGYYKLEKI